MEFYKVLFSSQRGELLSAVHNTPHSIIYNKVTYAPQGTKLFVFSDLQAARDFCGSPYRVIYRVNVINPEKFGTIIKWNYLNAVSTRELRGFWRTGTCGTIMTQPPDHTYTCDVVELLEEVW